MSRSKTPNPAQDGNNYDQNLLVDAPEASRAQLREGYDVDLLASRQPQRSPSVRVSPMGAATPAPPASAAPPPPVPQVPLALAAAGNGSKEQFIGAYASKPPTGFWRSRKGIITVVVIILVVIGAVAVTFVLRGFLAVKFDIAAAVWNPIHTKINMSWSNNPYPNQGGSYDRNLFIDAPRPPARLWPGYDVSLLEGGQPQHSQYIQGLAGPETSTPLAAPPHPVHQGPQVLAGAENGSKEQFVESGGAYTSKPRTGFWRSRKGIITVVVIILVAIGAVVGGAVGGTTSKSPSRTSYSTPSSSSAATINPSQTTAPAAPNDITTTSASPTPTSTPVDSSSPGTGVPSK
ncbi:hypothetical protein PISMIDRAFT_24965 [Pisolithus microcarpus 441]|uniref:Uncharacterized protein n=1 Tax=Pisolithus microcarpus 441 TaxID=765257 RepID=A0A0C9YSY5_9AGAM|nr:hypothetical protein PISMIDRAFT_24965 [Pisolithus microcarpus 441]